MVTDACWRGVSQKLNYEQSASTHNHHAHSAERPPVAMVPSTFVDCWTGRSPGLLGPLTLLSRPDEVIARILLRWISPLLAATSTDVRYAAAFGGKADISHGRRFPQIN
jgi:hypothetical protein